MKAILFILAIALASCGSNQMTKQEAEEIVRQSKENYSRDSLLIDQQMQIDIARARLEQTTGKKDTLTNEERLKKAREDFK